MKLFTNNVHKLLYLILKRICQFWLEKVEVLFPNHVHSNFLYLINKWKILQTYQSEDLYEVWNRQRKVRTYKKVLLLKSFNHPLFRYFRLKYYTFYTNFYFFCSRPHYDGFNQVVYELYNARKLLFGSNICLVILRIFPAQVGRTLN